MTINQSHVCSGLVTRHEREFPFQNISQRKGMVFPFPNSGKPFWDFPVPSKTIVKPIEFPVPVPNTGKDSIEVPVPVPDLGKFTCDSLSSLNDLIIQK